MSRYVRAVIDHRILVLCVCVLLSAASLAMLSNAVIASSIGKLFFGNAPQYLRYLERSREFGTDHVIILALEDVDVLAPETLDRIEAAVDEMRENDDVETISSILNAQRVRVVDGTLTATSYATEARKHPERRAQLLEDLRVDELAGGLLISKDGRHTAIIVELYVDDDRSAEKGPALVDTLMGAFEAQGFERDKIHRAGFTAVLAEMVAQTNYAFRTIFPFVGLVLLLITWVLFHRLWPVVIALGVSGVGVLWTMGVAVAIDNEISVMHSVAPIVILIVGFSDVIHLCSAYLLELSHGKPREEAILASADDVGRACFYTSITTFFGFIGMSFVPTPAFRILGIILGSGVAIALLLAITVVPIIFSYMRTPAPWRVGATSRIQLGLDRCLGWFATVATTKPRLVVAGFALAFGLTLVGLTRLEVDALFTARLADDNPVARDADFFADNFAAGNILQIFVDATGPGVVEEVDADEFGDVSFDDAEFDDFGDPPAEKPPPEKGPPAGKNALFEPAVFAGLASLQDAIAARDDVDSATSIVSLYERMHAELTASDPAAGRLPTTRRGLAEYAELFQMGGGEHLGRLVDFDRRTARIAVRLSSEAARKAAETGREIEAMAEEELGGKADVVPTGILFLMGEWLGEIIAGQRRGLIFTFVMIALLMCIGLRSVRVGLWSMLPNALPLIMLGGLMGFWYDVVDSDNLIMAMLAIGIGVDDTIHFMMRYRIEAGRTPDRALALKRTYDFAGRAIMMTTIVLAAGFAPMILSDYLSTARLGSLLPVTLILALLADLLLVPALAQLGVLSFDSPSAEITSAGA